MALTKFTPTSVSLNPQQELFASLYLDPTSLSFGNCYRSAIKSGYSDTTAKNLTHNNPKWLSEIIGKIQYKYTPELLLKKLGGIIDDDSTKPGDRIRAIELLMKHYGMFVERSINVTTSVETLLSELK